MSRAAVDAVLRAASKGSRLTIVEIGHGEFARALLRSLAADEAAQGCIEEIVVCSSSCDVEALADGLPPVPTSAWKSPCRKVCPCACTPRTGSRESGSGLLLLTLVCVPAVLCQPTQLAALRRALLKGKRVPAIVCVDRPPPALALRCIQLHLSLPTSLLVLAPESPAVGGASAKAVCCRVKKKKPATGFGRLALQHARPAPDQAAPALDCLSNRAPALPIGRPVLCQAMLRGPDGQWSPRSPLHLPYNSPCISATSSGVLCGRRALELRAAAQEGAGAARRMVRLLPARRRLRRRGGATRWAE